MKVAIIGTGYVGLVTGTCLSELGNEVLCVDVDKNKIEGLKQGHVPIYEPGLDAMIRENVGREQLGFKTEIEEALK